MKHLIILFLLISQSVFSQSFTAYVDTLGEFGSFNLSNSSSTNGPERISLYRKWPYGSYENEINLDQNGDKIILNINNINPKFYRVSANFYIYNNIQEQHNFGFKLDTGSGFQNIGKEIYLSTSYNMIYVEEFVKISGSASLEFHRLSSNTSGPNYLGDINIFEIL